MEKLIKWNMIALLLFITLNSNILLPNSVIAKTEQYNNIVQQDGSFILLSNGIVVDTKLNLMWATEDNGYKISIDEARKYISSCKLSGYKDWRIPTIQELETLLVHESSNTTPPDEGCSGNYQIHPFFRLTCCCPWALQDNGTRPASYPFIKKISGGSMWHHKSNTLGNRIIPVRDIK